MTTDARMTVVTALIRPHMERRVVTALHGLPEFPGIFLSDVRGQGRGRGAGGAYQATEFDLTYHRYLQLQIVCDTGTAKEVCDTIATAAWTGNKGDGVIFSTDADVFVRIRETGTPAHETTP